MSDRKDLCSGCRDDYYNKPGQTPKGECWSLATAQVVTRYRLHWWTAPTVPGAFQKVTTHSCWHAPGNYALSERLPDFVTAEERQRIEKPTELSR